MVETISTANTSDAAIDIRGLRFGYGDAGFQLSVPELRIAQGEHTAIVGPSGSGKTTLVSLISGILLPQQGSLRVDSVNLPAQTEAQRRDFRITRIGFVFQEFELLEYLTVRDNALLPYYLSSALALEPTVYKTLETLATSLGIGDKLSRLPRTLSHGEKQRAAICRALITAPSLLIADEPTGNLDPETSHTIVTLLLNEVRQRGATLLMVTHNHSLLDAFDRIIRVEDYADRDVS